MSPKNRKLTPERIENARRYADIDKKGPRAPLHEHIQMLTILFTEGISHCDLIEIASFRRLAH